MKQGKKLYLVWMDGEDEQFYEQYEDLKDVVMSYDAPVQVYEATPKFLGTFTGSTEVKVKKLKTTKVACKSASGS